MDLKILQFLIILIIKTTKISSEIINCDFTDTNVVINFQNVPQYGCNISNINIYSTQSDITGSHFDDLQDNDVKFVSYQSTNTKNLPIFSPVLCQKFPNLEKIQFSQIKVESIDENALENCKNLNTLSLTENKISKIPENFLKENSKLKEVNFGQNKLKTLPENIFANQDKLVWLDLRINLINSLPPKIFESLENLQGLWLGENNIRTLNPVWFENLQNLEELRLHGNKLTELSAGIFKSLTSLNGLYLSFNRIQNLSPDCFQNLENLQILSIGSNLITEIPANVFTPLINLEELWMHGNQLTVIHSDSFGNNKNLNKFAVQNNKINQIDKRFVDNTGVTEVNMQNNLCSQDFIRSRQELNQKLSMCFDNYQPRIGVVSVPTNINLTPKDEIRHPSMPTVQNSCGRSKIGQGQIIGGNFITRGAYPWIAALVYNNGSYFCGGTIVSDQKVLTAAHCIQEKHKPSRLYQSELKVLLGAFNLNERFEVGLKIAVVQKIHMHNDWNPNSVSFDSDIAVLVLESKIIFDNYIQPICMGSNIEHVKNGFVVGFGKSEDETKIHENIPKVLETPIHSNEDCFLVKSELANLSSKKTFCAGTGNGIGVCNGDSGSGLVVQYNGSYYLRGIVSSSLKGDKYECDVNSYAVCTNVLNFTDWINGIDVTENFYASSFGR
ncbi:uncharacterized protein [Chironomus tepperi]|uniref:uncharacterized protein n=1 Tax=Chironomus tepperi TaxID=113505 RepID=UPI00391EE355